MLYIDQYRRRLTLADAIIALGPLLYWKLDETQPGTTTAADSSGNGRTGSYTPGASPFAQQMGPDGVNYVDFGVSSGNKVTRGDENVFSINHASGLTMFACIKPDSVAGTTRQYIASKGGSGGAAFEWGFHANQTVATRLQSDVHGPLGNGLQIEQASVVTTGWQCVAWSTANVTQGARHNLFRNSGTPLSSTQGSTSAGAYANGISEVQVGWRQDNPAGQYWQGAIAHYAIYAGVVDLTTVFDVADEEGWF